MNSIIKMGIWPGLGMLKNVNDKQSIQNGQFGFVKDLMLERCHLLGK